MGADQIGYIMFVSQSDHAALEALVGNHCNALQAVLNKGVGHDDELRALGVDVETVAETAACGLNEEATLYTYLKEKVELARKFSLRELSNCRDVSMRDRHVNGKDSVVVFAGEMSYGDTPHGDGYALITAVVEVGLFDKIEGLIDFGAEPPRPNSTPEEDLRSDDPEENSHD